MKRLFIIGLLFLSLSSHSQNRFFGVAFDFNADGSTTNIGYGLHAKDVDDFLNLIKPDYIQVDTKGDYGIASFLTKVGFPAPNIVQDPLPVFRAETKKYGIGLYAHYNALFDGQAVKVHPNWGRLKANGQQDSLAVSIFSPYPDNYMIPQLKEISDYGLDGFWMDSDCWVVKPDYSLNAQQAYGQPLPISYTDTAMHSYVKFTRQSFHNYLNHYVNTLHAYNPNLKICSSWAYAWMLGPVDAKVDFLSGDLNSDSTSDIEYETRLLAGNGLPFDLMGWVRPTSLPLKKKAAIVLAQGGGFEVYCVQRRDASLPTIYNTQLKETADFCRSYQPYCYQTTPIPQIAVLISSYGYNKEASSIFSMNEGTLASVQGSLNLFLNMRYSTQVLQEHQFGDLSKYPLIVIPGWNDIRPTFVDSLKQYVKNGGTLLVTGVVVNSLFKDISGSGFYLSNGLHIPVKDCRYGTGRYLSVPVDIYPGKSDPYVTYLTTNLINYIFPRPVITVNGTGNYHINATTKNGENIFHVVNVDSTATSSLNVVLRNSNDPKEIYLQPGNKKIEFYYTGNGTVNFTIPPVDIYSIIEVKN